MTANGPSRGPGCRLLLGGDHGRRSNGYFENVWACVSDHDNDQSIYNQPDSSITQISIFGARGMLIGSQGLSWFYGGGSEHSVLYNYLITGAKSVYIGHIQTESPCFQPVPGPPNPFGAAANFPNDPDFSQCQIIDSTDVMIHSAGLYSFFNEYYQDCVDTHNFQERILEVKGSAGVVIFNLFTVAIVDIASGIDGTNVPQDGNQRGFTTEVSVWLPLPGADNIDIVWVGTEVWSTPTYGGFETTTIGGAETTVFVTSTATITISIPSIVTDGLPFPNVNVSSSGAIPITIYPSVSIPPVIIPLSDGSSGEISRTIPLPPWPQIDGGPSIGFTDPGTVPVSSSGGGGGGGLPTSTTYFTPIGVSVTIPSATVTTLAFPASTGAVTISCPATTSIVFATPPIAVATTCTGSVNPGYGRLLSSHSVEYRSNIYHDAAARVDHLATRQDRARLDDGVIVPCTAWFFFICISWGEFHVGSWHWALPPGIDGPGPAPICQIRFPPSVTIRGNLPDWPKITIGRDGQVATEEKPDCEARTAEACPTADYVSDGTTTSSTTLCETILGCSIRVSDLSTQVFGTQTPAPIGTWYAEAWATMTLGQEYTNSVYEALSSAQARDEASAGGTTIAFTPGPTAGPTCAGASTACGGTVCSGYWCNPTPTGYPPGYQDPKDPSSGGYSAPTTRVCTATGVCNCNENGCDECSPACCANGSCPTTTTPIPPPDRDPCEDFDCRTCGTPFDPPECQECCRGFSKIGSEPREPTPTTFKQQASTVVQQQQQR
ncbi:hypothetical protein F4824DRAFT_503268 [Ustulina deusta]|nr:hypothetical protein F4824DRAFT_503268 [Ustulina deusta]